MANIVVFRTEANRSTSEKKSKFIGCQPSLEKKVGSIHHGLIYMVKDHLFCFLSSQFVLPKGRVVSKVENNVGIDC